MISIVVGLSCNNGRSGDDDSAYLVRACAIIYHGWVIRLRVTEATDFCLLANQSSFKILGIPGAFLCGVFTKFLPPLYQTRADFFVQLFCLGNFGKI
jgi:hypothetical protein